MKAQVLLIFAVTAVGILHTLVPDHWMPITLLARQRGWSRARVARAAFVAGLGHTLSTLAIGVVVWAGGALVAQRFGHLVAVLSSVALVAFGLWIVVQSVRELRSGAPAMHAASGVTLMLILGSSPMVEGIPAFFAAARFGPWLLGVMSLCFAAATIATYVVLCVLSGAALERLHLGVLERYGEVISGAVIATLGVVFAIWPLA
ncbi:MAG TPA: hypothetical protein VIK27_10300 [Candidatus Aquilonibacter sp.]